MEISWSWHKEMYMCHVYCDMNSNYVDFNWGTVQKEATQDPPFPTQSPVPSLMSTFLRPGVSPSLPWWQPVPPVLCLTAFYCLINRRMTMGKLTSQEQLTDPHIRQTVSWTFLYFEILYHFLSEFSFQLDKKYDLWLCIGPPPLSRSLVIFTVLMCSGSLWVNPVTPDSGLFNSQNCQIHSFNDNSHWVLSLWYI